MEPESMRRFFKEHACNILCHQVALKTPDSILYPFLESEGGIISDSESDEGKGDTHDDSVCVSVGSQHDDGVICISDGDDNKDEEPCAIDGFGDSAASTVNGHHSDHPICVAANTSIVTDYGVVPSPQRPISLQFQIRC